MIEPERGDCLTHPPGLKGINLLDKKTVEARQYVFGEDFTIRSQPLADPNEEINIASTHPKVVAALRAKLDAQWTPKIATP